MRTQPCNKIRYPTKKDATSTIKYIKQNANRKKIPVRSYFCEECKTWHMTSQPTNNIVRYEFHLPEDKKIVEQINDILK